MSHAGGKAAGKFPAAWIPAFPGRTEKSMVSQTELFTRGHGGHGGIQENYPAFVLSASSVVRDIASALAFAGASAGL